MDIEKKEDLIKAMRLIHDADAYIVRFLDKHSNELPDIARVTVQHNRNTILQGITNIDEIIRRCED